MLASGSNAGEQVLGDSLEVNGISTDEDTLPADTAAKQRNEISSESDRAVSQSSTKKRAVNTSPTSGTTSSVSNTSSDGVTANKETPSSSDKNSED